MNRICPRCKRKYNELDNYCTKCGIALERQKKQNNR